MNLLSNWNDISQLSGIGWGGNKEYNEDLRAIELTAENGWQNWYWTIPEIENRNIIIEFDYKFTNLDNWWMCYVTNTNSYGGVKGKNLQNVTEWTHYRLTYSSTSKYIGLNVRGVDNTGKSLTIAVKNIQLRIKNSYFTNKIYKNGCILSYDLIEDKNPVLYEQSIYLGNIVEY